MNNKKYKVAFVLPNLVTGGIAKSLVEFTRIFDYDKYDVTVWIIAKEGAFTELLDPRVTLKVFPSDSAKETFKQYLRKGQIHRVFSGCYYRLLARLFQKDWWRSGKYAALANRVHDEEYDCAIAYYGKSFLIDLYTLHRIRAKKHAMWIHGEHIIDKDIVDIMDKGYTQFDRIYCVSKSIQKAFNESFKLSAAKTQVIYNCLDSDVILALSKEHCPELKKHSLLTVGRLAEEKGQQMIPAITRLLVDAGYDVYWYLVGDGKMREEITQEAEKHQVTDRVILLGTQNNPYPYIKNCSIYVQPSFSEGYCITVAEARALCKPIVTTDAPGLREQIIPGENGLIVEAMTPEALFDGIKTLLDHPEISENFIDNLKRESFDGSKELQKLYDFIES